jgi:isopenicillin N synthase-like dioxygenase
MRLLHYPSQERYNPNDGIGCGTHTDYGIVTILWQDSAGGLEVMGRNGEWFRVKPITDYFICNIGDAMEIWTNRKWCATPHRVINVSGKERYSIPMFFDPDYDCVIDPLPQFVSPERPSFFEPVTMGQHLENGFNKTFTYRKTNPASVT